MSQNIYFILDMPQLDTPFQDFDQMDTIGWHKVLCPKSVSIGYPVLENTSNGYCISGIEKVPCS